MKRMIAVLCLTALASCTGTPVKEADTLVDAVPDAKPLNVGASVSEIRQAEAAKAKKPVAPQYVVLGTKDDVLDIAQATIVDMATGCQYTVRTMFQKDLDISPRMEGVPGSDPIHRCRTPTKGRTGFLLLPGSGIDDVHVSAVRDQETGCQSIVGILWQKAVASTPRMQVAGRGRRQICIAPQGDVS